MNPLTLRIGLFLVALSIAGCVTTGSNNPSEPIQLQEAPITYRIPFAQGLVRTPGLLKDLRLPSMSNYVGGGRYERLLYENMTPSTFVVHRRVDNGEAGSGIKYNVDYSLVESSQGYVITLHPKQYSTYQQGLIGKFPVPRFGQRELHDTLTSGSIHYKFEVDSPFSPESTFANFRRLLKREIFRPGEKDPVTGKIFQDRFVSIHRGKQVSYVVEHYPYRNGSKILVWAIIPAAETSVNVVDYEILIREIEAKVREVVAA